MGRVNFGIEKGLDIFAENGDLRVAFLQGTAAPDGVSGDQGSAPLSSLYFRSGTTEIYKKIANAGAPADWEQLGSGSGQVGNWRPERVDAHTGQVLSAGVTDPTAWSDNDGGFDGTNATVGHYVLDGNCDLFEITVVGGASSITLAAAATAPVADDMFAVKYNLPDPAGQENQAIIVFDGSACIKVADVDFATAAGITLSGAYSAGPGGETVAANDDLESVVSKLDGNQQEIDQNVDDLITLSGVPENSTNMGSFTSPVDLLFSATSTVKALFQRVGDLLMQLRGVEVSIPTGGVLTDVDTVPHATVSHIVWHCEAFETATPANRKSFTIEALTDGTNVDDTLYARLRIGSNFNLNANVDVSGADLRLRLSTTTAGVTARCRRIEVVKTVL